MYTNQMSRLGFGEINLMNATEYKNIRLTKNYSVLNTLVRTNWLVRRICEAIPQDMVKNWFTFENQLTESEQILYDSCEEKSKVKEALTNTLVWSRLYGGAGALILIEGQEDILDLPLIPASVLPCSFKGLLPLDRWSGIYPSLERITDIGPDLGQPRYYEIRQDNQVIQKVHHSRVIKFIGDKLPYWEEQMEMLWGASIIETLYDDLQKHDDVKNNIASLVYRAQLLYNKVEGFTAMMATAPESEKQVFNALKQAQNQMLNNNSLFVMGKEDDFGSVSQTFSGLDDILSKFMQYVSGATEIPVTRLFGMSPKGLNATGESDENMYYDMIGRRQQAILKPAIEKLIPIIFMSECGYIPEYKGIRFNPVKTPSDDEISNLIDKRCKSITEAFQAGIISRKQALQELLNLSYTTGAFTCITEKDILSADNTVIDEVDLIGEINNKIGTSVQANSEADFEADKENKGQYSGGIGKESSQSIAR